MTHGDVDDDYLRRLAVRPDGTRRFKRLMFAAHFDSMMRGRRGAERPADEPALHAHRAEFVARLARLRREHGVSAYLAHNMTVTPANVDQIPELVRSCARQGWRMFSFQPAAFQGNPRRWKEAYRELSADAVWSRIEAGAGARLPWRAVQVGDPRCNRSSQGVYVGERWIPLLDDRDPRDLRARDAVFLTLRGLNWEVRPTLAVARSLRMLARRPAMIATTAGWAIRMVRRAGGARTLARGPVQPVTFVMHRFMDAEDVREAWALLERGRLADEPHLRETQERLQGCSYHMAHPETGRLVPACAQHAVYDRATHLRLAREMPARAGR